MIRRLQELKTSSTANHGVGSIPNASSASTRLPGLAWWRALCDLVHRRQRVVGLAVVLLVAAGCYVGTSPQEYSGDDLQYAMVIERATRGTDFYHPEGRRPFVPADRMDATSQAGSISLNVRYLYEWPAATLTAKAMTAVGVTSDVPASILLLRLLCGGAGLAFIYLALYELTTSVWSSTVATMGLAVSTAYWTYSTHLDQSIAMAALIAAAFWLTVRYIVDARTVWLVGLAMALTLALADAGLPPGYISLVSGPGIRTGTALVTNPGVRFVSFTGSTAVGRAIRQNSGLARTHLELGSNSVSIVAADADLDLVTDLISHAGYRKAGQVCTSVQRILADHQISDELGEILASEVASMKAGDPRSPDSDVGPLISTEAAARAHAWVKAAQGEGTTVVGGALQGHLLQPTLVISPKENSQLVKEEAFAPVVSLIPVSSSDDAIAQVNSGPYGLQVGFFTQDLDRAFDAVRRLEAGGVMINDTSSYHADMMPYGGVKESGHGVEGPKYAGQDMTDRRLVVLNLRAPGAR